MDYNERIRGELCQALKELEEIDREHLSPTDKDARMMKYEKGKSICFNSQALVDDANGLTDIPHR